jgi:putative transposase
LGYVALAARLTLLRRDIAWLADAPIHPLQQTLRDQDTAFQRFFEGSAEYPRFKPKGRDSFRFPDPKQFALAGAGDWLKLPKLGWVRLRLSRALPEGGRVLNITVSREGGHWYASLCVEHEVVVTAAPAGIAVGIDLGVANSLTLSTGERIHLPAPTKAEEAGLARLHRQVSRKCKGSNRWRRAVERLAKRKRHLAARRRDAAHKATTRIAKAYPLVVVEDLHLRGMSASAKGTLAEPGRNVAAKAGLNRSILAQAHRETPNARTSDQRHWRAARRPGPYNLSEMIVLRFTTVNRSTPPHRVVPIVKCGTKNTRLKHRKHLTDGLSVRAHGGIGSRPLLSANPPKKGRMSTLARTVFQQ